MIYRTCMLEVCVIKYGFGPLLTLENHFSTTYGLRVVNFLVELHSVGEELPNDMSNV